MTTRLTPPDWDAYDSNMLINVGDMKYYYENFTDVVDAQATENKNSIGTLDGRVTALEQSIPVGPGGDGAFLHLGGTPGRYPSQEEMVAGDTPEETSYMVIARPGGIYFYNPKTKHLISPKSGGGTIAVHAQFPQVFDAGHSLTHNGRAGMSGVYTAKSSDIGLGAEFTTFDNCKLLVVVNDDGEEYQTAFSPDGTASRIFRKGSQNAVWGFATGGGGGGGTTDPIVIQEIKDRLDALEAYDHLENITDLKDVVLDEVTDVNGLLYMDATGKIRGGSTNPMLSMGAAHVHTNAVGAPPVVSGANISGTVVASNNVIIFKGTLTKQVNLPNVVPYNTYQPTTSQVREGRTTFIVNTSDVTLTVRAPTGGMFYIEGNMDSTNAVIPAKTVFVYNPAILDNGSGAMIECWIYMGNYPLRATDLSAVLGEIQDLKDTISDLKTGNNTPIDAKSINSQVYVGWDTVYYANSAKYEYVTFWGNSTKRGFELPDIVGYNEETVTPNSQVRVGRTITITNKSTTTKFIRPMNSCTIWRSDTSTDGGEFTIPYGQTIVLTAWINGSNKYWVIMGSYNTGETPGADTLKADIASGAQLVNWNSIGADPISTSGNVTAANMASAPFCVGMGTGTTNKFIMAEIADRTVTSLTSTQVREGRVTFLVNMGTQPRVAELTGGCKFNMTGSNVTTSQTVPSKAVWMFSPGIYSNGDKVWTFLGSFSTEALDLSGLNARLGTAETQLTDAMDRLGVVEDAISDHLDDFTAMQDGHIPTSWNGLGARPVSSLNDITTLNIADSPFCIGTGSVAGKKFILPNIADMTATHLGDEDVREGRTTYLINLGTVSRTVELTNGCKINVTGGTTSASQTIPRKTVWILSPGIHAGEKVWTFIGTLSAQTLDIESLVDRLTALESRPVVEKFTDLTDTPADYRPGQVLRYNQAGDAVISTEFGFKHMTDTPSDYTGHKGKMVVVNNGETAVEFQPIPDTSGLQSQIDDNHNDIIALQNMDTVIGNRVTALENAGGGTVEADLASGDAIVNLAKFGATNKVDWETVSQTDAANSMVVSFWGNANSKSVTLPDIVGKDVTPVPANAVRTGRLMFVSNRSTTDKVIKVADSCLLYSGGHPQVTSSSDFTLKPGNSTVLISHLNGSAKWWVFLGVFTADQTIDTTKVNETATWKEKVESGDSAGKVNSNCMYGAMQIVDGNLTSTLLAACTAGYVYGSTARTCTLPQIVDVNASSVSATQARFGKQIRIGNMTSQATTVSVQGGGRIYKPDGSYATSVSISAAKFADFHAVWWPGGGFNNFAWVMMQP